jgi:two-component system sensor histidine kinase UhpB
MVMRRAALVVLLALVLAAGLGWLRARDNVRAEVRAATALAQWMAQLGALQAMDDSAALQALNQLAARSELRHLRLQVLDGQGRLLLGPEAPAGQAAQAADDAAAWPGLEGLLWHPGQPEPTVAWPLSRGQARPWTVALTAIPQSEEREATADLLGMMAVLGAGLAVTLLVMQWNVRRAFRPLSALLKAISGIGAHDHSRVRELPPMPIGELEALAHALRQLGQALDEAEQHRRALSQKVLTLQEDERVHLARELHDEFGQRLTALRFDAAWLLRQVQGQPELHKVVQGMAERCAEVQRDVRDLLGRLHPLGPADSGDAPVSLAQLDGLIAALVQGWRDTAARAGAGSATVAYRQRVELVDANLPATAEATEDDCWLPRPLALAVYRLTQEALTNCARHAGASTVNVAVSVTRDGASQQLHWRVADDGRGLGRPELALRKGNGLGGMQERVWALGGEWRMESPPGLMLQARFAHARPASPQPISTGAPA